jgi:hypothetical protein
VKIDSLLLTSTCLKEASKKGPAKVMSMCGGEKIKPAALSAVVVKGVTRYSPGGTCENPAQATLIS